MKKRLMIAIGIGIFIFISNGCTVSDLSRAKDHWGKKDFEWIAGQAYDTLMLTEADLLTNILIATWIHSLAQRGVQ